MFRKIKDKYDKNRGCQEITKQRYDKNQDYQEKIKPRYKKIKIAEKKKSKIVIKKLRFSRKNETKL